MGTQRRTVRHVPLIATLAPIWTPSAAPTGKLMSRDEKSVLLRSPTTSAMPCTMPAAHRRNADSRCLRVWPPANTRTMPSGSSPAGSAPEPRQEAAAHALAGRDAWAASTCIHVPVNRALGVSAARRAAAAGRRGGLRIDPAPRALREDSCCALSRLRFAPVAGAARHATLEIADQLRTLDPVSRTALGGVPPSWKSSSRRAARARDGKAQAR